MSILKWLSNRKYRVFARKAKDVDVAIWEQDFKIAKSRQIREGIRQDRERTLEAVNRISAAVDAEQDPEKKKALEAERASHADNATRYEAQMRMIDNQINGVPAQGENPGENGILETIQSLAELRAMYQQYMKDI